MLGEGAILKLCGRRSASEPEGLVKTHDYHGFLLWARVPSVCSERPVSQAAETCDQVVQEELPDPIGHQNPAGGGDGTGGNHRGVVQGEPDPTEHRCEHVCSDVRPGSLCF